VNEQKQLQHVQNVTLVAAPWPLFNRPSIQIGALKAYLNLHLPDVHIDAWHLFLNIAETIGYKFYQALSQRTWLAESVYAAMLYPQRTTGIGKRFDQYAAKEPDLQHIEFNKLVATVRHATDSLIKQKDWSRVDMAGFSVSLCQMTASLYLMNSLKRMNPGITIVVGGTTFCGPSARDFLDVFTNIDFIVQGEGEIPLTKLIFALNNGERSEKIMETPGVVSRHTPKGYPPRFSQIQDLEQLPQPDYTEYFKALEQLAPQNRFFPALPIEASRGCWWNRSMLPIDAPDKTIIHEPKNRGGCAFCNLNLQWQGYRTKSPRQVAREVDRLTTQHQTLSVTFVDNVMPPTKAREPFSEIIKIDKDIKLFGEIRANTSLPAVQRMRKAGLQEVQVGIESLSAGLLKKMNKGTRVIQNLEIMKHCEMLGLKNRSNLIIGFPGSDEHDVDETMHALDYAMLFQPLKPVRFWLGLESPIWRNYREFKIKSIANHPGYGVLFPTDMIRNLIFIIQAYRGDVNRQQKLWRPVEKRISQWFKQYADMHKDVLSTPILSFMDGGTFLIIRQRKYRAKSETHRLSGLSREIYLFCLTNRSLKRILLKFPGLTAQKLLPFLRMMRDKRLMYREDDRFLSLAVPEKI
jgi:ribosomal peptide maturation radical SAM protein 1